MFISYSQRFILVHIPKTAGGSIREALKDCGYIAREKLVNRARRRLGIRWEWPYYRWREVAYHATAAEIKAALPKRIYEDFFKFAFVRNPWDWLVSHYFYIQVHPEHAEHEIVSRMADFREYARWYTETEHPRQRDFLVDEKGGVLVDFIGRFENVGKDFGEVCRRIGVEARLPHENRSRHEEYRKYYDAGCRELVAEYFQEDIRMFNYRFD